MGCIITIVDPMVQTDRSVHLWEHTRRPYHPLLGVFSSPVCSAQGPPVFSKIPNFRQRIVDAIASSSIFASLVHIGKLTAEPAATVVAEDGAATPVAIAAAAPAGARTPVDFLRSRAKQSQLATAVGWQASATV